MAPPDDITLLIRALEKYSAGEWTLEKLLEWAAARGMSPAALRAAFQSLISQPGRAQIASLAKTALQRMATQGIVGAAEVTGAAEVAVGTAEVAAGTAEVAAGAGGGAGAGLGLLGGLGLVVLVGLVAYGAYRYYHRNDGATAGRVPGVVATPLSAPAAVAAPDKYSRVDQDAGVLISAKQTLGLMVDPDAKTVTFEDPNTHVKNTIAWEAPPLSIISGQKVRLRSWTVGTPNQGADVEVHWETPVVREYGASSRYNEPEKITEIQAPWSQIDLVGGPREAPLNFRIRWKYEPDSR